MKRGNDATLADRLSRFFQPLINYLQKHDPGSSADAYFCVSDDGDVLANVGEYGFEECTGGNAGSASPAFRSACKSAGGTVKGGCIPE